MQYRTYCSVHASVPLEKQFSSYQDFYPGFKLASITFHCRFINHAYLNKTQTNNRIRLSSVQIWSDEGCPVLDLILADSCK